MSIRMMETDSDILATFPVMKQLRPHLAKEDYVPLIRQLQADFGYRLIALLEEGEVAAAAGYRYCQTLASGQFLYVDDLITDEKSRSRGFAEKLFDWLEREAAESACLSLHLDSGVQRFDAHRFYLKRKMRISCHHFDMPLK
ncbi:GNAT family N-acetyltransferase [Cohnella sp. AR92]|uniref:GNAT family N-acetyltransferase n=1 Tax=Cohnella sp. AR92 TaxID=648716 RepID=UPI000F8E7842|nr:GNAT family N-acetyltransferase [Cohnella sp. AR92]RUS46998.1 GNAT family N-acetyltransferase [Cohnella sp. AR92]